MVSERLWPVRMAYFARSPMVFMLLRSLLLALALFLAAPRALRSCRHRSRRPSRKPGSSRLRSAPMFMTSRPRSRTGIQRYAADEPASTIKLVTTYAALELLGPTYTWKTDAYIAGTFHDGVLTGDLVLKGSGDPKLTLENFWLLLRGCGSAAQEIRGDLVLDRTAFDAADWDPARFDGEPMRATTSARMRCS